VLIEGMRSRWAKPIADAASLPAYMAAPATSDQPPDLAASQALFSKQCGGCHGASGEGGEAGPLKAPAFLALVSDQSLRRIIITGRPDLNMPNYRERAQMIPGSSPISSAEIDQLVALMASWRDLAHAPRNDQQASR
jgi:mono/diheme cytochrome c family protein